MVDLVYPNRADKRVQYRKITKSVSELANEMKLCLVTRSIVFPQEGRNPNEMNLQVLLSFLFKGQNLQFKGTNYWTITEMQNDTEPC